VVAADAPVLAEVVAFSDDVAEVVAFGAESDVFFDAVIGVTEDVVTAPAGVEVLDDGVAETDNGTFRGFIDFTSAMGLSP
jgi:hypothetical protein